jgi:DNA-binding MarR family transcriptional regulator
MTQTSPRRRLDPAAADRSADRLNNRIFFRLFQVANTLQRQTVKALGVTTVQWAVLGALSRPSAVTGMTFGDLADYLIVSRQNLDGVLQRLERERLVERVTDPDDRRARRVRLTPSGQRRWQGLQEKIYEFYDQAAGKLGFDERVTLAHCLNKLLDDLQTVEIEIAEEMRVEKKRGAARPRRKAQKRAG